jgi:hypothetical protein
MTGERVFYSLLKPKVSRNLNQPRARDKRYCPPVRPATTPLDFFEKFISG